MIRELIYDRLALLRSGSERKKKERGSNNNNNNSSNTSSNIINVSGGSEYDSHNQDLAGDSWCKTFSKLLASKCLESFKIFYWKKNLLRH